MENPEDMLKFSICLTKVQARFRGKLSRRAMLKEKTMNEEMQERFRYTACVCSKIITFFFHLKNFTIRFGLFYQRKNVSYK